MAHPAPERQSSTNCRSGAQIVEVPDQTSNTWRVVAAGRRVYRVRMSAHTASGSPLTAVEEQLVEHVTGGRWLDLAGDGPVDEAAMQSWEASRPSGPSSSATFCGDVWPQILIRTGYGYAALESPAGSTWNP